MGVVLLDFRDYCWKIPSVSHFQGCPKLPPLPARIRKDGTLIGLWVFVFEGSHLVGHEWRKLRLLNLKGTTSTQYTCPILTLSFDTDLRSRCFEPVISIYGKAYENTLVMVGWH